MTTEAPPTAAVDAADGGPTEPRRIDPFTAGVALIVLAQAVWFGVLFARGWYYQDDVAFLAQATGRSLTGSYLTDAVNDHLTPGLRLVFWLLHPLGLRAYGVTVAARLVLQAVATVLLWVLLTRLGGRGPLALAVVAAYAFSPLLIGATWLSCAAGVLPSQVLVLAGYLAMCSYARGSATWTAAVAGVGFGAAACFLELSAVDAVLVVPLVVGFVYRGGVRDRAVAFARHWLGWALAALPSVAFAVAYLAGGYGGSARPVGGGTFARFAWHQWSRTVAPLAVGGPWRWFSAPRVYFSASDPPLGWVIAAQCLVAAAVAASLFRVRARRAAVAQVLLAWSLPLVFVLLCSLLLVVGRFAEFGYLSAQVITYAFGAAVPCALAVFLAFTRPTAAPDAAAGRRRRPRATRRAGPALATLVALQLAAAAVSELRFTHRWAENPTERYVSALRAGLDRHPGAALFDTPLPLDVLPFTEPDRYLSDVVPLLGRNPSFTAHSGAMIVDAKGRLRPATFLPAAAVRKGPPGTFCDNLLSGVRSGRYGLDRVPQPNEWFLDLDYFQQHPSVVHVWLVDARGHRTAPVGGDRVVLAGTLDRAYLRFPSVRPVAVVIESRSADTNTCFANLQVGYPFPRKAGS